MVTPNKGLTLPANGSDVDTWDAPMNANFTAIDTALGGITVVTVTGASGTVVLTSTQYTPPVLYFSGTLSASVIYQVPSGVGGVWVAVNGTSGAFTLTISSGGGGGTVVLAQGYSTMIWVDGSTVGLTSTAPVAVTSAAIIAALGYTPANGLQSNGQEVITGTTTLGAGNAGYNIIVSGTPGYTITFPSTATTFWLNNASGGSVTLSFPTGTDFRTTLFSGERVGLAGDGGGFWRVVAAATLSGSPLAGTSLNATGNAVIGGALTVTGQAIFETPIIAQTAAGPTYGYAVRIQAIASGNGILQYTDSTASTQWAVLYSTGANSLTIGGTSGGASLSQQGGGAFPYFNSGTNNSGSITVSASGPSGTPGNGDIWIQHA